MYLTPYDLYDIYAVLLLIRAYPADEANASAVSAVKEVIDAPPTQFSRANAIRIRLGNISELDREKWFFIDTQNVYTWMPPVIRDERVYAILSACMAEMLEAVTLGETERIYDLADALHNIPIILAEGEKGKLRAVKRDIKREISYVYRPKWNKDFLRALL